MPPAAAWRHGANCAVIVYDHVGIELRTEYVQGTRAAEMPLDATTGRLVREMGPTITGALALPEAQQEVDGEGADTALL